MKSSLSVSLASNNLAVINTGYTKMSSVKDYLTSLYFFTGNLLIFLFFFADITI